MRGGEVEANVAAVRVAVRMIEAHRAEDIVRVERELTARVLKQRQRVRLGRDGQLQAGGQRRKRRPAQIIEQILLPRRQVEDVRIVQQIHERGLLLLQGLEGGEQKRLVFADRPAD